MARSRRTPAMIVGICCWELSGRKLQRKIKKSQTPSVADLSRRAVEGSAVPRTSHGNAESRPPQICHLDRTRISCHAALDIAACAAFAKESSIKCANATKFYRKSGGAQRSGEICGFFFEFSRRLYRVLGFPGNYLGFGLRVSANGERSLPEFGNKHNRSETLLSLTCTVQLP
jgi:hypothetical protein